MTQPTLAFIGGGNMAASIIGGLIAKGYPADAITATAPSQATRDRLAATYKIATSADNASAAAAAEVVILAVKPQILQTVAEALRPHLAHQPLVLSIAAGIPLASLGRWLGESLTIVRAMPNTPSLVQTGAAGLYATDTATASQRALAEQILSAVGIATWLDSEADIDAVIAVAGSAPAYFFLMMEAMIDAGVAQGLSRELATALTLQTALGSARLAQQSDVDVAELRRRVMSPGGTTEQAVHSFEADDLRGIVARAMRRCADRSAAMAEEMG